VSVRRDTARRVAVVAVAVVAGLLAAPATAPAVVSCDYSSTLLSVTLDAQNDFGLLSVEAGQITLSDNMGQIACTGPGGPPTVMNTGTIAISGSAPDQAVYIDGAADFVPGPDPQEEGGGSKEIEIFANLDPTSLFVVIAGDGARDLIVGSGGVNANSPGELAPRDADIIPVNVGFLWGLGGSGNDYLYAQGGLGTGGPRAEPILLAGGGGSDLVTGGDGADYVDGGQGNDAVFGMAGDDQVLPGLGDDTADGGPGSDTVVFDPDPAGTLDLAIGAPQDTGEGSDQLADFENVSAVDDSPATLLGDDRPNALTSSAGDDTLTGRGGFDLLESGEGADTLDVRDGGPDTANCGPGTDTVTADALGVDTLVDCETVLFPPPFVPPPAEAPPPGAGAPPGGVAPLPAVRSLRLRPAAFAAAARGPSARDAQRRRRPRGSLVSFTLNVPAAVTYRVGRAMPGRRVGRRCAPPSRANRRGRRCTRFALVSGRFTRMGRAGSNRFRFTGRIGGRRLTPGSYRLRATPRAAGRTGRVASAAFRVLRRGG
jgi:hypothetical protein